LTRLLDGWSASEVAAELGINRSTVSRWMKNDPEFVAALSGNKEISESARGGLADLVPRALSLLEQALQNDNISASRATVALNVVKAAASLGAAAEKTEGTLAARLAEIDARANEQSNRYD